jgi:hypothetical protein
MRFTVRNTHNAGRMDAMQRAGSLRELSEHKPHCRQIFTGQASPRKPNNRESRFSATFQVRQLDIMGRLGKVATMQLLTKNCASALRKTACLARWKTSGGTQFEIKFGVKSARQLGWQFNRAVVGLIAIVLCAAWQATATAAPPAHFFSSDNDASTSAASRRDAVRSVPLEQFSDADREKVRFVLSNTSLYRRLPTKTVDCDPVLYFFLLHHPDVVVNIWEEFKISRLQLQQTDENQFQVFEPNGVAVVGKFVYQSRGLHVLYGEGTYQGPLFPRSVKGRGVLVLKTAYAKQASGRYHITTRMDCFLNIDSLGVELATKTVSPLLGKTVDNNFMQTLAFVGSLSRTAELNSRGVQRLASQLKHVSPEVREHFEELVTELPDRVADGEAAAAAAAARRRDQFEVASQNTLQR